MELQQALQKEMDNFLSQQFTHDCTKHFSHIPALLLKSSPTSLKVTLDIYEQLANVDLSNLNYQQAGSFMNILITQTPTTLNVPMPDYIQMQKEIAAGVLAWREVVLPEQQRVQNKLAALEKVEEKSGRKINMPAAKA